MDGFFNLMRLEREQMTSEDWAYACADMDICPDHIVKHRSPYRHRHEAYRKAVLKLRLSTALLLAVMLGTSFLTQMRLLRVDRKLTA